MLQRLYRLKWWKKILLGIGSILLFLIFWHWSLIYYGMLQGYGQFKILWEAHPIEEVLADPKFPDSLKIKIRLIQDIKQFAIDSIGLSPSQSYEKVYDQKGKPILWIVTACEPYELKAMEWSYGFLGRMSYKGFFDLEKAKALHQKLKKEGWDTEIDQVAAWSTLGWFNDPILTSMLRRNEGSLASLIIHELTHSTIWIKNNVEYNENVADFIGDYGAMLYLESKYGKNSEKYQGYINYKADNELFYQHLLNGAKKLEELYATFPSSLSKKEKDKQKYALIREITETLDTVSFANPKRFRNYFKNYTPNNTFFMGFIRYRSKQNQFREEFYKDFGGNFPKYLAYLKEKYGI